MFKRNTLVKFTTLALASSSGISRAILAAEIPLRVVASDEESNTYVVGHRLPEREDKIAPTFEVPASFIEAVEQESESEDKNDVSCPFCLLNVHEFMDEPAINAGIHLALKRYFEATPEVKKIVEEAFDSIEVAMRKEKV